MGKCKSYFLLLLTTLLIFATPGCSKRESVSVAQHLQNVSVTVFANEGSGSGVVVTRKDATGNNVSFVWTAAHVVLGLTNDAIIAQYVSLPDGTSTSRATTAELIAFDIDIVTGGVDLALLRVREPNFFLDNTAFLLDSPVPPVGTALYHVGSFLGEYQNSMSQGIVSQTGIEFDPGIVFDQMSCTAFPGSSGGGVFLTNGLCVGLADQQDSPLITFYIPIRRMEIWAKENDLLWALDPRVPIPY